MESSVPTSPPRRRLGVMPQHIAAQQRQIRRAYRAQRDERVHRRGSLYKVLCHGRLARAAHRLRTHQRGLVTRALLSEFSHAPLVAGSSRFASRQSSTSPLPCEETPPQRAVSCSSAAHAATMGAL